MFTARGPSVLHAIEVAVVHITTIQTWVLVYNHVSSCYTNPDLNWFITIKEDDLHTLEISIEVGNSTLKLVTNPSS